MSSDITRLLEEWPYDSDDNVRIVAAEDGRSVLQVRQPLGIEQYELDGRPDGMRLEAHDTVLDEIEHRLAEYELTHGSEEGFEISEDDATQLHNEGVLYYYRYLLLFQLNDFERVIRDTSHNLRICDVLERHAVEASDAEDVLQFKPYIYRMHAAASAMDHMEREESSEAREILEEAIDTIQNMEEIDTPAFQFERVRSVSFLRTALEQIEETISDPVVRLRKELDAAIRQEDYEEAARLRDSIRELS